MRAHYCKVSTVYIYSVIADVRLLMWQRRAYTFIMYSVRCTLRAYCNVLCFISYCTRTYTFSTSRKWRPNTCQMTRRKRNRHAFRYKIRVTRLPTQNPRVYLSHSELTLFVQERTFPVAKTVQNHWPPDWWGGDSLKKQVTDANYVSYQQNVIIPSDICFL